MLASYEKTEFGKLIATPFPHSSPKEKKRKSDSIIEPVLNDLGTELSSMN